MKVALNANLDRGVWQFRREIIRQLVAQGHEVCVICPHGKYSPLFASLGARHIPIELDRFVNPLSDVKLVGQLYGVFRAEQFDIVHNLTIKPNIYGTLAARLAGVPRIVGLVPGLGSVYTEQPRTLKGHVLRAMVSVMYPLGLRLSHRVWFQNRDDYEFFLSRRAIRPGQGVIIKSSGIDVREYTAENLDPAMLAALRQELDLDDTTRLVTMVSRAYHSKGVLEFIQAADAFAAERGVQFLLVGPRDDPAVSVSEEILTAERVNFRWLGFRDDVKELLAISDIVVLPSRYREGVPHVLLEAMALGRPIITTDSVGCRETVVPGHNGLMIPIRDSEALVQALRQMLADDEMRLRFGRASRELAERQFDERHIARRVLAEVYELPESNLSGAGATTLPPVLI